MSQPCRELARGSTEMARNRSRPDGLEASGAGGAAASLELLYRQHSGWLLRAIRQRFGRDQADDLVQETYLRATAYQGKPVENPRALLLRIATRAAIDSGRRAAVRPQLVGGDEHEHGSADVQAEALALKQIILGLPPDLRDVFVLSRFGGMTYEEIAAQCGISVKTVEWRMSKALRLCAATLTK